MGLDWNASEKIFAINLPDVIEQSVKTELTILPTRRKSFDISTWGPNTGVYEDAATEKMHPQEQQYHDALPDDFQMPEYGEKLEEGEPPKGDPDSEDGPIKL